MNVYIYYFTYKTKEALAIQSLLSFINFLVKIITIKNSYRVLIVKLSLYMSQNSESSTLFEHV
jgi:hypothetical protein